MNSPLAIDGIRRNPSRRTWLVSSLTLLVGKTSTFPWTETLGSLTELWAVAMESHGEPWRYARCILVMTNIANWKDPPVSMEKLMISMAIFHSYVTNYQRVCVCFTTCGWFVTTRLTCSASYCCCLEGRYHTSTTSFFGHRDGQGPP